LLGYTKAQTTEVNEAIEAGKYDMGKMWTFDYPPVDFFKQTYNFSPDEKWFENARLSALRFANYCSASFVSANGLVMTNHHCARESGFDVQNPGESFNENGFFAVKLADERKVPGLYVDQLIKIEDITARVQKAMEGTENKSKQLEARANEFKAITEEYKTKDEWKGLEIQTVTFYSGGKYSLYGFKRYSDVRLVFMPEVHLGFYGGDYDNFTYPRYDLDCSFFRVYDEKGEPLKTKNYFKFTKQPVQENDPVFVIGNPGSTGRLWTISDLEYRRDVYLPNVIKYLKNRSLILQEYNKTAKSDSLINEIFGMENSIKALGGELDGLKDPNLIARKKSFETKFKSDAQANTSLAANLPLWEEIEKANGEMKQLFSESFLFSGNPGLMGGTMALALVSDQYAQTIKTDPKRAGEYRMRIKRITKGSIPALEEQYLAAYLTEAKKLLGDSDPFIVNALQGKTPAEAAKIILTNTKIKSDEVWNKLVNFDTTYIYQSNDPLLLLVKDAASRYLTVAAKSKTFNETLVASRGQLGRVLFELYGTQIPPDATFSLRISDGIVKGYEYNGTLAPPKTTFFGLYDRFYSFNKKYPWTLPQRWQKPPKELLPVSMNFVSTNDIIGGNSGSPIINKNLEVVGLVFDGNIESLPGRFIYITDKKRTVSVDATGILCAIKYIYKAKRLEKELSGN
jgi:V8-like Glu-specific endopeptidase